MCPDTHPEARTARERERERKKNKSKGTSWRVEGEGTSRREQGVQARRQTFPKPPEQTQSNFRGHKCLSHPFFLTHKTLWPMWVFKLTNPPNQPNLNPQTDEFLGMIKSVAVLRGRRKWSPQRLRCAPLQHWRPPGVGPVDGPEITTPNSWEL